VVVHYIDKGSNRKVTLITIGVMGRHMLMHNSTHARLREELLMLRHRMAEECVVLCRVKDLEREKKRVRLCAWMCVHAGTRVYASCGGRDVASCTCQLTIDQPSATGRPSAGTASRSGS
jgi:hypothetical protein